MSDLVDPATLAALRAAAGDEPPVEPAAAEPAEEKALPSFIKDKIANRDDSGDGKPDGKPDPKRTPHAFVGDGGLCKKCMAPKGAKVHVNTENEKSDHEIELKADGALERKSETPGTMVLAANDQTGVVEALVSVTGVEDRVKDIIEPGAYTKTMKAREPIGVWSHDDKTWVARKEEAVELMPGDPFFKGLHLPDGSPWPTEAGAVKVKARFNLDTTHGREAYSDVKFFKDVTSWSIGYRATLAHRNPKTGVRHIKELDWFEFSPVMVGAAAQAMTLSVKSMSGAYTVDPDEAGRIAPDEALESLTEAELASYGELKASLGLERKNRVKTPEGASHFGLPIGAIITRDAPHLAVAKVGSTYEVNHAGHPLHGQAVTVVHKGGDVTVKTPDGKEHVTSRHAENGAADARLSATDEQAKLNAINKRRRAKGQAPFLKLPNQAKSLDLAEVGDDELLGWEEPTDEKAMTHESLDQSPKHNWVEDAGGLPAYIEHVAKDIAAEHGIPLSRAIPMAIGRVKKWARGGPSTKPETVAKAVEAVAQWEALKARSGKKFDSELLDEMEVKGLVPTEVESEAPEPEIEPEVKGGLADPLEVQELLARGAEVKAAAELADLIAQGDAFRAELPPFS